MHIGICRYMEIPWPPQRTALRCSILLTSPLSMYVDSENSLYYFILAYPLSLSLKSHVNLRKVGYLIPVLLSFHSFVPFFEWKIQGCIQVVFKIVV